jgi:hypothetical protein
VRVLLRRKLALTPPLGAPGQVGQRRRPHPHLVCACAGHPQPGTRRQLSAHRACTAQASSDARAAEHCHLSWMVAAPPASRTSAPCTTLATCAGARGCCHRRCCHLGHPRRLVGQLVAVMHHPPLWRRAARLRCTRCACRAAGSLHGACACRPAVLAVAVAGRSAVGRKTTQQAGVSCDARVACVRQCCARVTVVPRAHCNACSPAAGHSHSLGTTLAGSNALCRHARLAVTNSER